MSESIFAPTTRRPLTTPTPAPAPIVNGIAAPGGKPECRMRAATTMEANPISAPTARLMTPAASGTVTAMAASTMIDWVSSMERHTPTVRNVSGTQIEKITNMTTNR